MGLCLSCLRPEDDSENDYNENSSLLQNHLYLTENIQEDILKQQQRQSELNGIVNDLSDKLIDVTNFLGNPSHSTSLVAATPNLSFLSPSLHGQSIADDLAAGPSDAKGYPRLLTDDEKLKILKEIEGLDPQVKKSVQISVTEPLYLKF